MMLGVMEGKMVKMMILMRMRMMIMLLMPLMMMVMLVVKVGSNSRGNYEDDYNNEDEVDDAGCQRQGATAPSGLIYLDGTRNCNACDKIFLSSASSSPALSFSS